MEIFIGKSQLCDMTEYVSNMGNILTPYSIATGEENYYLLNPNFSFIKKKIRLIMTLY